MKWMLLHLENQNGLEAAVHGKELRGLTFHNSRFVRV